MGLTMMQAKIGDHYSPNSPTHREGLSIETLAKQIVRTGDYSSLEVLLHSASSNNPCISFAQKTRKFTSISYYRINGIPTFHTSTLHVFIRFNIHLLLENAARRAVRVLNSPKIFFVFCLIIRFQKCRRREEKQFSFFFSVFYWLPEFVNHNNSIIKANEVKYSL